MKKKIFITGGTGFIGFFLARNLATKGHDVVAFDSYVNYVNPRKSHYGRYLEYRLKHLPETVRIIRGDIRNKGELLRAIREEQPDVIVHLAALPISTTSNTCSEDAMSINLNGTVNVLESLRECPFVKRFVYTSSSMVYGDFQYAPADEKHPINPLDVYGGTKKSGEVLTKVFSKQFDFEYVIIRPSAVYGPTDANRRVSQIFVENALLGKKLLLHNGGESKLDFSYVEDVAEGFALAVESPKAANETFNITRGEGRSLKELAAIIKQHVPGLEIETQPVPRNEKRPERGALDITKARNVLGYDPKYSLEKGIGEYIAFIREMGVLKGQDHT